MRFTIFTFSILTTFQVEWVVGRDGEHIFIFSGGLPQVITPCYPSTKLPPSVYHSLSFIHPSSLRLSLFVILQPSFLPQFITRYPSALNL